MFKFLRKYNKWILAVGGTLLMIVFLVPQAIQQLSQRAAVSGSAWGTIGPSAEKVTGEDRLWCERDLQNLDRIGLSVPGIGNIDNPAHWFLLVREAEAAGLVGGVGASSIPLDQRQQIISIVGTSGEQTLARFEGVQRMIGIYASVPKLSDRRLKANAQERFYGVNARLLVLEAQGGDDLPMPSEDAITAQFDEFRDVVPGEGEHGFGYKLPDRFKLEWLTIDAATVRASVEASGEVDDVALLKHWRQQGTVKGFPPLERGAEIPDVVRNDLIDTLTTERLEAISNFASDRLKAARRPLSTSDEGYYVLPDEWADQRLSFTDLAESIRAEFEGLELPRYESSGAEWLAIEDLADIEGLGTARTRAFGNQFLDLARILPALKEFGGDPAMIVQSGVAGPPLSATTDRSLFLFRVIDADASRPPASVDEVRDEIITDLRRLADFQRLVADADRLEADVLERGMLTVAMDNDTVVQPTTRVAVFDSGQIDLWLRFGVSSPSQALPVIGVDEDATKAIVERGLEIDRSGPLEGVPREQRTFVLPVENKLALLVVEIFQEFPFSAERYAMVSGQRRLQGLVLGDEIVEGQTIQDVFGYEALAARNQFEVTTRENEDTPVEETPGEDAQAAVPSGS
jgi:hypothetical protein